MISKSRLAYNLFTQYNKYMLNKRLVPFSIPSISISCPEGFVRKGLGFQCTENTFFNRIAHHLNTQFTYALIALFLLVFAVLWFIIFRHWRGNKILALIICSSVNIAGLLFCFWIAEMIGLNFSL